MAWKPAQFPGKIKVKLKYHSGLNSTQERTFFKIKVLSEQQKGRVSESHWPKGRELYDFSLDCFGCFWTQHPCSRHCDFQHPPPFVKTNRAIKLHRRRQACFQTNNNIHKSPGSWETWYRIHTGTQLFLFQKGINIIKIIHIWQKCNWNHLYFCLPRMCFIPLKKTKTGETIHRNMITD